MAWTTPTTRSTGDLITAANWNTDLVDNLLFLHNQVVDRWFPVTMGSNGMFIFGDYPAATLSAVGHAAVVSFDAPADYASLAAFELFFIAGSSATITYDRQSDYGAPGETYNNHSSAATGITLATTANNLYALDISGLYGSLAGGDMCGFKFTLQSVHTVHILGVRMRHATT